MLFLILYFLLLLTRHLIYLMHGGYGKVTRQTLGTGFHFLFSFSHIIYQIMKHLHYVTLFQIPQEFFHVAKYLAAFWISVFLFFLLQPRIILLRRLYINYFSINNFYYY